MSRGIAVPAGPVTWKARCYTGFVQILTRVKFVFASWDETIRVWDARSATEVLRLDGHTAPVRSIAFDAPGMRLVSTSQDGTWRVWDTRWLVTLHRTELARRVCAEGLLGDAQVFSAEDVAADRTLSGLVGENPCRRHD